MSQKARGLEANGQNRGNPNTKLVSPGEQETKRYIMALRAITHVREPLDFYQEVQRETAEFLTLLLSGDDEAERRLVKMRWSGKASEIQTIPPTPGKHGLEKITTGGMFVKKYGIEKLSQKLQRELLAKLQESIARKVMWIDQGFACRMLLSKEGDQQIVFEIEAVGSKQNLEDPKTKQYRAGRILKRFNLPARKPSGTEELATQYGAKKPLPEADTLQVRESFENALAEIRDGKVLAEKP